MASYTIPTIQEFVDTHIRANANQLISFLSSNEDSDNLMTTDDYDALQSILCPSDNKDATLSNAGYEVVETEENDFYWVKSSEAARLKTAIDKTDIYEASDNEDDETVAEEYFCDFEDAYDDFVAVVDPNIQNLFALEFYIVSDYLENQLHNKDQITANGLFNLNIWGRQGSGQAIYMDSVIIEIYTEHVALMSKG